MAKLNEKQVAAIEYLSAPKRSGMTYQEIADEVGVSKSTLFEWKKKDYFNNALNKAIVRKTQDRMPDVMDSIVDNVIETGNAAAFRTLVQMHGMLTEKIEVDNKEGSAEDLDEMREKIRKMRGEGSE